MKRKFRVALAGNANVGKSVVFNYLTELHQHIGNWPGKTIEKAEGTLHFKGNEIDVIDLPGIYSLTTFSIEELVSREYIALQQPDVVVNIVDASVLERNLFFTFQLLELETPLVIALNMVDIAEKKGIKIDVKKLSAILGVPVVPTVAVKGRGLYKLVEKVVGIAKGKERRRPIKIRYGKEVEERIERLAKEVKKAGLEYPPRWTAIKLLEGDKDVQKKVKKAGPGILSLADRFAKEIEKIHGEPCSLVITSEKYAIADRVVSECAKVSKPKREAFEERMDAILLHRFFGYFILVGMMLLIFTSIFTLGDFISGSMVEFFDSLKPFFEGVLGEGVAAEIVWGGVIEGAIAGLTIALPYLVPFFIILAILEDSGYMARIAFLMDNIMHKIGLHGKAFIPLILGYGCTVPACLGCRVMETQRERFLAGFLTTLVPCAARTVIILGLVGAFVGIEWALGLYLFNLLVIFVLGRIAFKVLPGEPMGMIMEMPSYKSPSLCNVAKETWMRLKDFIYIAFPVIIITTAAIKILEIAGFLEPISSFMSPITVGWLGLPAIVGVTLIFGILRKELTLVMLAVLLGTENFAAVLTPTQMIVFALVTMFYIPCIATIATLAREFGWKRAIYVTVFEIGFAILLGGVAFRLLGL